MAAAVKAMDRGRAVVVVDPRANGMHDEMAKAARLHLAPFLDVTPEQPGSYRFPWHRLSPEAIAAVVSRGAHMREGLHRHVFRLYLAHAAAVLQFGRGELTLEELVRLDPLGLRMFARRLGRSAQGRRTDTFLGQLSERDEHAVCVALEFLRTVVDCNDTQWFGRPTVGSRFVDLSLAVNGQAVVCFNLDMRKKGSVRRDMFAAAVAQDLLSVARTVRTRSLLIVPHGSRIPQGHLQRLVQHGPRSGMSVLLDVRDASRILPEHVLNRLT
jgi:hypothetical protein